MTPEITSAQSVEDHLQVVSLRKGQASRRYMAKLVDSVFCSLLSVLPTLPFARWLEGPLTQWLGISASSCLMAVLFDASCISTFATTPGKSLFGIHMHNKDGSLLSFPSALKRSANTLFYGSALMIPFFSALAGLLSYRTFIASGATSWDEGLRIDAPPLSVTRKTLIAALCLVPLVSTGIAIKYALSLR